MSLLWTVPLGGDLSALPRLADDGQQGADLLRPLRMMLRPS